MTPLASPSLPLQLLETRWLPELAACAYLWPLLQRAPRGDGHPVLVIPGFLASGVSTFPMRSFLKTLGYRGHRWKLGRNLGPLGEKERQIAIRLRELHRRYRRRVTLVGWSLGGIYARELAWMEPDRVRAVITLGSPFALLSSTPVSWLYEDLSGQRIAKLAADYRDRVPEPPPVPSTAVYSRSDGVVNWRASLERRSPTTENIRVRGSHLGLGHNPAVLWAIADRLAQPEGEWQPFRPPAWLPLAFPRPDQRPEEDAD